MNQDPGRMATAAIRLHSQNVRRLVLDRITPGERLAIAGWSGTVLDTLTTTE